MEAGKERAKSEIRMKEKEETTSNVVKLIKTVIDKNDYITKDKEIFVIIKEYFTKINKNN